MLNNLFPLLIYSLLQGVYDNSKSDIISLVLVLVLVSFSQQSWLFNGQVEDSTVGDFFSPT